MRQKLTNKLNKYIEYDPNAKGYRYIVDGEGKSSVTTVIGTYKNTKAFEARKRNKCLDALKTILLKENKPLDEINSLIEQAKKHGEELEKYEMTIGSDLHEFIELYLKGKKLIFSTKEPLKTMQHKFVEWWDKQKFIVKELEFPMYSSKYDRAGCLDIIVTKEKWNGELALMDFKTSVDFFSDQPVQLFTYKNFLEESTDLKIQRVAIVNIPKDKGKPISLMPLSLKYEKRYFKAFTSAMYLEKIDKFFNDQKKKFKKENKRNV